MSITPPILEAAIMAGSTIAAPIKMVRKAGEEDTFDPSWAVPLDYETIFILGVERLFNPTLHEPDTVVLQFFCCCDGLMRYIQQAQFEPEWGRYNAEPWVAGS